MSERNVATSTCGAIFDNQNHAEFRAHRQATRKQFLHAVGTSVGGDVVIGGSRPQEEIAHATADQIGLMAVRRGAWRKSDRRVLSVACANYAPVWWRRKGWFS